LKQGQMVYGEMIMASHALLYPAGGPSDKMPREGPDPMETYIKDRLNLPVTRYE